MGLPLMSLMPKISESGNEADTKTFKFGDVLGASTSSSGICLLSVFGTYGQHQIPYSLVGLAK